MKKIGTEGSSYVTIKCPFKLIYRIKGQSSDGKMEFELIRREDKHIHNIDYEEND